MKKLLAIILLHVQLYNLGGYMALYQHFVEHQHQFIEAQISKDLFNESDLVEIEIPNHSSSANYCEYQAVSGAVQLQEGWYNYVKIKITEDALFLKCVPNYSTTHLLDKNIIHAKNVSDAPLNAKKPASFVKGMSVYQQSIPLLSVGIAVKQLCIINIIPHLPNKPVNSQMNVMCEPPERRLS